MHAAQTCQGFGDIACEHQIAVVSCSMLKLLQVVTVFWVIDVRHFELCSLRSWRPSSDTAKIQCQKSPQQHQRYTSKNRSKTDLYVVTLSMVKNRS